MPRSRISPQSDSENDVTNAFDAQYTAPPGNASRPTVDPTFNSASPFFARCRNACARCTTAFMLSDIIESWRSSALSTKRP
jgi:hypothetical protein